MTLSSQKTGALPSLEAAAAAEPTAHGAFVAEGRGEAQEEVDDVASNGDASGTNFYEVTEDGADVVRDSGGVGEVSAHATAEPQEDILDPVSTSRAALAEEREAVGAADGMVYFYTREVTSALHEIRTRRRQEDDSAYYQPDAGESVGSGAEEPDLVQFQARFVHHCIPTPARKSDKSPSLWDPGANRSFISLRAVQRWNPIFGNWPRTS